MTLLLLIVLLLVAVAVICGSATGPTVVRRRSARPVIHEYVYDEPAIREEVVEEDVVDDAPAARPVTRTRRRRVVEY